MNNTGFTKTEQIVTTPKNKKGVGEILKCVNSNESYEAVLLRSSVFLFSKSLILIRYFTELKGFGVGESQDYSGFFNHLHQFK